MKSEVGFRYQSVGGPPRRGDESAQKAQNQPNQVKTWEQVSEAEDGWPGPWLGKVQGEKGRGLLEPHSRHKDFKGIPLGSYL